MYARKNNLAKFIKVKVTSCEAKYCVPYSEFVLYIPPIQMHTVLGSNTVPILYALLRLNGWNAEILTQKGVNKTHNI